MKKSAIREKYLQKRKQLSSKEVEQLSQQIFSSFLAKFKPQPRQKVHVFLPISKFNEINTHIFIDYFFKNKLKVFVPKIQGNTMISVQLFPDSEIVVNSWGVPEPITNNFIEEKNFDFVLTPLLYCDQKGNRVGYGKGFYDDFFLQLSPEVKKIGLNYYPPIVGIEDFWEGDIPLDYLVLPREVLSF
jgi:5-formyltetrahydrofolate cyclo-ligase